jgi:hypothetical protein
VIEGVHKFVFTWADHLSNFFAFNLFFKNVTFNFQNKNILS